jgi:uncharacterized protein
MITRFRKYILWIFTILAILSIFQVFRLQFSFDFEQFFPKGDEDLEFFREFVSEFESDDNFMLVAISREQGVFEQKFLTDFHEFSLKCRQLPHILEARSLTQLSYPIKTPFAITTIPIIHLDRPERYARDSAMVVNDPRFVHNLIDKSGTLLVVYLKTKSSVTLDEARELMSATDALVQSYSFENYHYLGRPYFQQELVDMQKREIIFSAIVSGILVTLVMFLLYRRTWGILIALTSIAMGLLLFLGFLGITGRPLSAMAALYPVLMIIVGTSDVIHIMTKYIAELRKGETRESALQRTIKEIGLATLLTSVTTAIGFMTLLTTKIEPVRDFGVNAAIGVLIAYITVIFFTTALLSYFNEDDLVREGENKNFWENLMDSVNESTKKYAKQILIVFGLFMVICFWGISKITTNFSIATNFPIGKKITADFKLFEEKLTSFRPFEIAVTAKEPYTVRDFEFLQQMDLVESKMREYEEIQGIASVTDWYKSIHRMNHNNRSDAYIFPKDTFTFNAVSALAQKVPANPVAALVSKDEKKARISARIKDIGATKIQEIGEELDRWIVAHTDENMATFKRTGTGLIIDKNSEYVRKNLLEGLTLAIGIVALIMAFLFRNYRILFIAIVPNVVPLLVAGAILGFMGIELEAGISIVFAVIFGIAVDDSIHFLSKYKLALNGGKNMEEAIDVTFKETGKAICLTSIILFFGFMIMLFSIHPPSVIIGVLISITLLSALLADLYLIPVLLRKLMPPIGHPAHQKI